MLNTILAWWKQIRGRHRCNKCKNALDISGYCEICNSFPYRKWLTEEECLYLDDEEFKRTKPDQYAKMENEQRKNSIIRYLKHKTFSRETIVDIYGEDLVREAESESD